MDHANIVSVVDIGRSGNDYYFTMEYLHGENLHRVLARAVKTGIGIPLEQAVFIIVHLCMALHYAHELADEGGKPLNIVHRDVSPTNIMLTYEGAVKILDFGVAKAATQTQITKTGVTKGKASYMSPEQCQGKAVDRRSDVFALGILLYEMTTLRPLFRGENDLLVMQDIVSKDAPSPSSVVPNYPKELEAIVTRALARDPAQRYPNAAEFERDLSRFARLNNLSSSTGDFAEFVRRLFGSKPHPWRKPKVLITSAETPVYDPTAAPQALPPKAPAPPPTSVTQPAEPLAPPPERPQPEAAATIQAAAGPVTNGEAMSLPPTQMFSSHDSQRWIAISASIAILAVGGALAYVLATGSGSPEALSSTVAQGPAPADGAGPPADPAASKPTGAGASAEPPPAPPKANGGADPVPEPPACPDGTILIEGGTLTMGTNNRALPTAAPEHTVEVAPFCMDVHEVTDAQFRECSDGGECLRAAAKSTPGMGDAREQAVSDKLCNRDKPGKEQHPVNCVTWDQARMYCAWKSMKLPTEQQWEFAARGSEGRRFPWGVEAPMAHRLNACGNECRNWRENLGVPAERPLYADNDANFGTAPVGSFAGGRTPEGVEDLAGNVLEWTAEPFKPYPGAKKTRGLPSNARVLRGGSFSSTDLNWVSGAARHVRDGTGAYVDAGFRCVTDPV